MAQITNSLFSIQGTNLDETAINVDSEGFTTIKKLVILDSKDGSKWDLFVYDGQLIIEPHDFDSKRDFRIKKVLD
jgi:hypothetical protein